MNLKRRIIDDLEPQIAALGYTFGGLELVRLEKSNLGDFSTNIAFKLSHGNKQSPINIAIKLTDSIKIPSYIEKLQVAGQGFVNIHLKKDVWQDQVKVVLDEGAKFGSNGVASGKQARVEFVSANPTGPLHFGNARGGPIGDVLASVLEFCGYKVIREYYHNNIGGQIEKLGESIVNVAGGAKLEDQEYKGEYIADLAAKIKVTKGSEVSEGTYAGEVGKKAVDILLGEAIADCESLGIKFDKIYSESEFLESGKTAKVIAKLQKAAMLKPNDGAIWFAPRDEFLDDRETVVVKGDESYTYFANDIAYHEEKFASKPDLVIDVFGSNHHGHVPRLQAVINALGYDVSKFHVILYQWVRFKKGKELLKMSKRSGNFITTAEVLEDIGRDAVRFFILAHDANSPIDFDLDLAKEKSNKNPVYYVQYAHARIASIFSKVERPATSTQLDYSLLTTAYEIDLIKQITKLPELVEDVTKTYAVHHLASYATELADSFHRFYENCRILPLEGKEIREGQKELEYARIALAGATKITLANTLALLGVAAPEKM